MRYLNSEQNYIVVKYVPGATVTVTVIDLVDNSIVVNAASMSEINSTGYFKYLFDEEDSSLKQYLYITSDGVTEHAGKVLSGGYPDIIKKNVIVSHGLILGA